MNNTTFRDLLMILLLGFVFMIVAMIPHLNPPTEKDAAQPPGNVIVNIAWPDGNYDVDLWLFGPGEAKPVGYTNKSGRLWNLLRDDLGTLNDPTGMNYENGFTRGINAGEYIINVHCFRCPRIPMPVTVVITVKPVSKGNQSIKMIASTVATIRANKEEITALRFRLTKNGALVPDSLSHRYTPLRSAVGHPGGEMVQ